MTFNIELKVNGKKKFLSGGRFDNLIKDLETKKQMLSVQQSIKFYDKGDDYYFNVI